MAIQPLFKLDKFQSYVFKNNINNINSFKAGAMSQIVHALPQGNSLHEKKRETVSYSSRSRYGWILRIFTLSVTGPFRIRTVPLL